MLDHHFEDRIQAFKELHLVVLIMNRPEEKKVTELLRRRRMPAQFMCFAHGTASSAVMDMLGLGSSEKAIIFGFVPCHVIPLLFSGFDRHLELSKRGKGVAFSIPLSGMRMPAAFDQKNWQSEMESRVNELSEGIKHDLIVAIVDEGNFEEVMDAARGAGATGGTTFHALRIGMEDAAKFFGFPIQDKKDVVTILTKREHKLEIMRAINEAPGMKSRNILFSLPADNVFGLQQQDKAEAQ